MQKKGRLRKTLVRVSAGICLTIILTTVFLLMACAPPAPVEPVKIGALVPMTGASAESGPVMKAAIELRLDEAGWKVAGRPVELIVEDSGTDVTKGLEMARKMVEFDKVHVMILEPHMGVRLAVAAYLATVPLPNMCIVNSPVPAVGLYQAEQGWGILTSGDMWQECYPLAEYAYERMGVRTVTAIASDFVAGRTAIAEFAEAFQKKGGTVIQEQWAPLMTPDYGPYLVAMQKADAVVAWFIPLDAITFLKQYDEFGLFAKMPVITPICGPMIEDAVQPAGCVGIKGSTAYKYRLDNPLNKEFVEAYKAKTGVYPIYEAGRTYIATQVVLAGLEATGGDTTPEKLRQAILGLKLDTIAGPLSFTPDGGAIFDVYIWEVKKIDDRNEFEPIYTFEAVRPKGE